MAILRNGERRGQNGPARDVWRHGRDPCGDDALALVEEQALRQRSAAPSRREVLLGLGAASALAPLAACSAPRGDSAASREAAATGPTVQVEFLHSFGDATPQGDTMGRLIGSFNTSQRRVEVRSQVQTDGLNQKRLALFAAGVPPDISWDKAATFLSYADKGLLMPVGDYARRKPPQGLAMADWIPEFWEYVRWRGKEWTLPFESSSMVIVYNKALLERDSVPPPKLGWTWDDFVDAARRLTHADRNDWGYANDSAAWIFRNWLVGNGGTWYRREGDRVVSVINSAAVVEALQKWSDLWLRHRVATLTPPPDGERTGKIALWTSCVGIPGFKRWGIDFGTTTIPRMQRDASYWCDKALSLSRTTDARQEAAWAFMRWFVQDETYLDWIVSTGYLPLTKTQIGSAQWRRHVEQNPQYEAHIWPITRGHLFGVPLEPAAVAGELDAPVGAAIQAVLKGEKAPKPALDEAKQQVDDRLAQGIRF